jgi:hypothetical protein
MRPIVRTSLALTLAILTVSTYPCLAWEKGNHADTWKKGQTIKVCVDKPPSDADHKQKFSDDVDDAIKEWNDAQAEFGGLKLDRTDKEPCDIKIHWKDNQADWGDTAKGGPPVDITMESDDGINDQGLKRMIKHEMGHAEGLGHSDKSDVMDPGPYARDSINAPGEIKGPNADDKAGKKAMYGTAEKASKSTAKAIITQDKARGVWVYSYTLTAASGSGLTDPITELTLTFPMGVTMGDLIAVQIPPKWQSRFYVGGVRAPKVGEKRSDNELPPPPTLSFTVPIAENGLRPGQSVHFRIESKLPPSAGRAFTNSPHYDSDEFQLQVPSRRLTSRGPNG